MHCDRNAQFGGDLGDNRARQVLLPGCEFTHYGLRQTRRRDDSGLSATMALRVKPVAQDPAQGLEWVACEAHSAANTSRKLLSRQRFANGDHAMFASGE